MKRSQVHTGDRVFVNTLNSTREYIGANNDMHSLIGSYIDVLALSRHYNQAIKVIHPSSEKEYTIHCDDISIEPILKKHPRKIIKVEHEIKAKFDVNTLTV